MVLPSWIGIQGDVVEGGRSVEALVWEQWPLLNGCGFVSWKFRSLVDA
jgi:hypothetical protein